MPSAPIFSCAKEAHSPGIMMRTWAASMHLHHNNATFQTHWHRHAALPRASCCAAPRSPEYCLLCTHVAALHVQSAATRDISGQDKHSDAGLCKAALWSYTATRFLPGSLLLFVTECMSSSSLHRDTLVDSGTVTAVFVNKAELSSFLFFFSFFLSSCV